MTGNIGPRLKVAFFGSPSRFSGLAFERLAACQSIVALVLPGSAAARLNRAIRQVAGLPAVSPLEKSARALGIDVLTMPSGDCNAIVEKLRGLRPDIICIALFPTKLSREVIESAPMGAINVHPSLLPRHRGPLPLFWTYHCDDREAGVTIHHADGRFDAGDVIVQESMSLPRAYPVAELDKELAYRAAALLSNAVAGLAAGGSSRTVQDERNATRAPLVRPGVSMVPFEFWHVERVGHFLGALYPQYREPLVDENGDAVMHGRVLGYGGCPPSRAPGSVEARPEGWMLHCRDGTLLLAKYP